MGVRHVRSQFEKGRFKVWTMGWKDEKQNVALHDKVSLWLILNICERGDRGMSKTTWEN